MKHVHLDTSDPSCIEDVSKYLSRKIGKLAEDENLDLEIWPERERFEMLCDELQDCSFGLRQLPNFLRSKFICMGLNVLMSFWMQSQRKEWKMSQIVSDDSGDDIQIECSVGFEYIGT